MAHKDSFFSELFDNYFNLYRLSPLHFSLDKPLLSSLNYYAKSLARYLSRELPGSAILGSSDVEPRSKLGNFKNCTWVLKNQESSPDSWDHDFFGILIRFEFEKSSHAALLLKKREARYNSTDTCIYFPLLLTSLPSPWYDVLSKYLAATFGPYIHPLTLPAPFLRESLDETVSFMLRGGQSCLEKTIKDVSLVLDFARRVAPSLKRLDITFRREDLLGFSQYGQSLLVKKGNTLVEHSGAFMTAVLEYMHLHLAMDLSHKSMSISKVTCGTFALSKCGKFKLLSPSTDEDIIADIGSEDLNKSSYTSLLRKLITEAEGDYEWIGFEST